MENNLLKWYGHVLRLEDKRWPKGIIPGRQKEEEERKPRNEVVKGSGKSD
jgi:hypothetical protein